MISDNNLIIPEYKIELQNKNKKIIKKIENIEKFEKNFIKRDYNKNKFKNKKYIKISKSKKKYNYQPKIRKDSFDSKKLFEN